MPIIQTLKAEQLRLRKERNPVAASIGFAIAEIDKIGKNDGNRETTEDESIKVMQKIVTILRDNLKYDLTDSDADAIQLQISIFEKVLPMLVSDAEIIAYLTDLAYDPNFLMNKGTVMKALRAKFGALVDMKHAAIVFEEFIQ